MSEKPTLHDVLSWHTSLCPLCDLPLTPCEEWWEIIAEYVRPQWEKPDNPGVPVLRRRYDRWQRRTGPRP